MQKYGVQATFANFFSKREFVSEKYLTFVKCALCEEREEWEDVWTEAKLVLTIFSVELKIEE